MKNLEQAKEILNIVKENTLKEVLYINAIKENTFLYDSKFGGFPYLPKWSGLPENKDGQQLRLLCQINFENLPDNTIFPNEGILQFYVNDIYNLDFDNQTKQDNFRVVYHENIDSSIKEDDVIKKIYDLESWDEDEEFPIQYEYKLEFEISKEGITIQDYNFDKLFNNECNKLFINTIDDEVMDEIYDDNDEQKDGGTQHKIGGYPFFTQQDPREDEKSLSRFDTLLLQIDTEEDEGIVWGDCGVCNFFINCEDLKNKNFNNVLFNWDCY